MLLGTWLVWALLSLLCWGLVNVLDSFFVESEGIYHDPYEGMIVSSLYKIVGALIFGAIFFTSAIQISTTGALVSITGGMILSAAFMFYFYTLFYHNDTSLVQLFWNLSIPIIVLLAWFFLGEDLGAKTYIGIAVVFAGALSISYSKDAFKCDLKKFSLLMLPMVFLYSVSEVLMKYLEDALHAGFSQSFAYFCLGQALFGLILLSFRWKQVRKNGLVKRMLKSNLKLFITSESLELGGIFFMLLAIAQTPSVSLFGTMEAFMPILVIILTGVSAFFLKIFGRGKTLGNLYDNNLSSGLPIKIIATVIMMIGVYLIG